jgi:hypothetical protein
MGAYDSELYAMEHRFTSSVKRVEAKAPTERELFLQNLHVAKQPCVGSCGDRCLNHWCNSHNLRITRAK